MNMPHLIISDEINTDLAVQLEAMQLEIPTPGADLKPRDVAVQFFAPMAHVLMRGTTLCLARYWRDPHYRLDAARARLLDRVALALGAVLVQNDCCTAQSRAPTVAQAGSPLQGQPHREKHPAGAALRSPAAGRVAGSAPGLPTVALGASLAPGAALAGALTAARLASLRGPGVGAWRTDERGILIVGDRPNNPQHGAIKQRIPFFSMHNGGCSLWLSQQLEDAGIPENRLYWINAYHFDGEPTDSGFYDEMNPMRVIALGAHAAQWCKAERIDHDEVPHPAFWKQYRNDKPYPLMSLLKEVV